jgi:hypothetical protein
MITGGYFTIDLPFDSPAATCGWPVSQSFGWFIGEDPIVAGFAKSFARPGGSVTGIVMFAPELDAKRPDLLHDAVSGVLCRGRVFPCSVVWQVVAEPSGPIRTRMTIQMIGFPDIFRRNSPRS